MVDGIYFPRYFYVSLADNVKSITKKQSLLSAYEVFLDDEDNKLAGKAVEPGHDRLYWYDVPEYKSGEFAWRNDRIYEPWFAATHGEESQVRGALLAPPNQETGDLYINDGLIGRRVE